MSPAVCDHPFYLELARIPCGASLPTPATRTCHWVHTLSSASWLEPPPLFGPAEYCDMVQEERSSSSFSPRCFRTLGKGPAWNCESPTLCSPNEFECLVSLNVCECLPG